MTEAARWLFVSWSLVILVLVLAPLGSVPTVHFTFIDKVVHFSMFFVLGFLAMASTPRRRTRLLLILFGVFYAVITEILQGIVPWDRTPSHYDVIANLAGLAAGALCSLAVLKRIAGSRSLPA